MIEKIIIIALLVNAIHYVMQPGEIFSFIGAVLSDNLPEVLHNPVFDCNVCMTPWYGTALYFLIPWPHCWQDWLVVVIAAMGLNVVINLLKPDK
jgi:hypothetical protein